MNASESVCPGCGLRMPRREGLTAASYYNTSPECWSVYTEILAAEYSNALLFGQVHQRTVDTYAVQHAGGPHPDKSMAVHLAGLLLVIDRGMPPHEVPAVLQRIASPGAIYPHFEPPIVEWPITVFDVAMAGDAHADVVRQWSETVWREWAFAREAIARMV
jgi:hypothetical protein